MSWDEDQYGEAAWWGSCANTYGEESKQFVYARAMGLNFVDDGGPGPVLNLNGRSVADIGGGPVSLLLKTRGGRGYVVDPCAYPDWVKWRYTAAGIMYIQEPGETAQVPKVDECWIYNVLQHTQDPRRVIKTARSIADTVRIFEWVEVPAHPGHPHVLHVAELNYWLGGSGNVRPVNEAGAVGLSYSGVFRG